MAVKGFWQQYLRVKVMNGDSETNFQQVANWNEGGGVYGWVDLYDAADGVGLNATPVNIFPTGKSGQRALNAADPVQGAYPPELGSFNMPVYPELLDRLLYSVLSQRSKVDTAGVAAKASTAFGSLADLDTQPADAANPEQLKFTISGSSAASGASIDVIVNGTTVETITIADSAASVDGDYYTQGAYGPTITFATSGTVTGGNVVVAGIKYTDTNLKMFDTLPYLVFEQAGRIEEGTGLTNSQYFAKCNLPTLAFNFDRTAADGLLMVQGNVIGAAPVVNTATGFQNAASQFYKPFAPWNGKLVIDGVDNAELRTATLNINSNDEANPVASGQRGASGNIPGRLEVFAAMTVVPVDTSRWDDFENSTPRKVELVFTAPYALVSGVFYTLTFTANRAFIETYTPNAQGVAQGADIQLRMVRNDTDAGPIQADIKHRMPV